MNTNTAEQLGDNLYPIIDLNPRDWTVIVTKEVTELGSMACCKARQMEEMEWDRYSY